MPIRIYALAKELDIDSKELVVVCTKAGVTGKGSALASLTDDEVAKVKAHLNKSAAAPSAPASKGKSTPPPMTRPTNVKPVGGKIPVIQTKRPAAKPEPEPPAPEPTPAEPAPAPEAPVADAPKPEPVAPTETAPAVAAGAGDSPLASKRPPIDVRRKKPASSSSKNEPRPKPAPVPQKPKPAAPDRRESHPNRVGFTRDDYIAPGGTAGGKPPVLGSPKSDGSDKGDRKGQGAKKGKGPVIKLANIPQSAANKEQPKTAKGGAKAQKPIMTLPRDAISRAKAGGRAPLEQFTRQHDKKRNEEQRRGKPGGGGGGRSQPGGPPDPNQMPLPAGEGKGSRRRGHGSNKAGGGAEEGEGKKLAGMASARAARQNNRRRSRSIRSDDDDGDNRRRSRPRLQRRGGTNTAAPRKGSVVVELPCTVRSLSEGAGVPSAQIQRELMKLGMMVTINAELENETAELIAAEMGMEVEFRQPETAEDSLLSRFEEREDDPADLETRPPIVTFLGHVDHGKTSLLDRIMGINVVDREAGGITQHIRAYKIDKDGREIAFVDTPGHAAFTDMRARGANVTDIAVLVVAADDGVMPQTEEAISHARAAEVPIVVAMNKIDVPGADENKVYQDLSTHGLLPTEWGGDVEVVKTSAITGDGIDDLLETLLLTAELHEYQANPKRDANGICLEARQDGDRGVITTLVVTNGTLKVGDIVVCGDAFGKVRAMIDPLTGKRRLKEAGPSTPVSLTGLNIAPAAGESFYVVEDVATAREIAETRQDRIRSRELSGIAGPRISFEDFQERLEAGTLAQTDDQVAKLNLILRADVRGSIEAIKKELEKLEHPEVRINILQATVGGVTSADVSLADASEAVIVGFNVIPDEAARSLADERGVEIRRYDIIYKVTEDLKALLEGKLKPEERMKELGRALVQRLFTISRVGTIAGCRVLGGTIERGCRIRVNREGRGIGDYPMDSLRREKDDVKEVREGYECGIKLAGFNNLKEGDILEAYKIEEVARTL